MLGRMLRQAQCLVHQMLIWYRFAATHAGVGRHHHLRLGVVDASGQAGGGKPAEHDRMDGTDAHGGEHGKNGLRDHGHVDEHPVAPANAQALQYRGEPVHLCMQLLECIDFLFVYLCGNEDQRVLVPAFSQVPIHRIVAKVGLSSDEPFRERRPGIVQHMRKGFVPVNELCLLTPEGFWLFNGATMNA